MNRIESELFDEFKYVDKICREMFNAEKGVSAYIEQMETTPYSMRQGIYNWDIDYKTLKHIRWVRNQIAHETGYVECTVEDLNWLKDFHRRLLTGRDPLAQAYAVSRAHQQRRVAPTPVISRKQQRCSAPAPESYFVTSQKTEIPKKRNGWRVALAVIALAAIAAVIGVGLLYFLRL